jgi:hypothetical protein
MIRLALAATVTLFMAYLVVHPATVHNAANPAQMED